MENLRRKEHDTSATVSDEGSSVVRTKLSSPLLRKEIVGRWRLPDSLRDVLHSHRLKLIVGRSAGRGAPPERLK